MSQDKNINLRDMNQNQLSIYYRQQFATTTIAITDSYGRMTNSFNLSKTNIKKLIKFLQELEK